MFLMLSNNHLINIVHISNPISQLWVPSSWDSKISGIENKRWGLNPTHVGQEGIDFAIRLNNKKIPYLSSVSFKMARNFTVFLFLLI